MSWGSAATQCWDGGGASTPSSPYTILSLLDNTTYYFQVQAHNALGWGPYNSPCVSGKTFGVPYSPANLVAAHSGGSNSKTILLTWSAPSNNGGTSVTNYKIYRTAANGAPGTETLLTTVGNVLTYTNTGLTKGATYYYKVTAVNAVGGSNYSNEAHANG